MANGKWQNRSDTCIIRVFQLSFLNGFLLVFLLSNDANKLVCSGRVVSFFKFKLVNSSVILRLNNGKDEANVEDFDPEGWLNGHIWQTLTYSALESI